MTPADPALPRAIARAGAGARLLAWHAERGRRLDDVASWTFHLAMALAAWHAATVLVAVAWAAWGEDISVFELLGGAGLLAFLGGVAAGVQCVVIALVAMPCAWLLSRLTRTAGPLRGPLLVAATALGVLALEPTAAIVWRFLVGGDGPLAVAQVIGATAIGALYGTWLGSIRSDRA